MTDLAQIPYDDDTRPAENVVDLMRRQIKRRVDEINAADDRRAALLERFKLERALYSIRPEPATGDQP